MSVNINGAKRGISVRRLLLAVMSLIVVTTVVAVLVQPASAVRFLNRGMYINSSEAGAITFYTITLQYSTPAAIGSLRLEFCDSPIPDIPCNVPDGLDVSGAVFSSQSGETGFTFDNSQTTSNVLVLSRTPSLTGGGLSTYRFDNMHNPNDPDQEFYVRMNSYFTTDASGPFVDYGSVSATTVSDIYLSTQVPPIIRFCVAQTVALDCSSASGNSVDFGELDSTQTFSASTEMAAYTNAQYGYVIYVTGSTFTSGVRSIPALTVPTQSFTGVGQFGINLATNTAPALGADPTGPGTNAVLNPTYTTPDYYLFNNGDALVTSSDVTLNRKFTATYILNVPEGQPAGVYSTTITYLALASF